MLPAMPFLNTGNASPQSVPPEFISISANQAPLTNILPPAHQAGDLLVCQFMNDSTAVINTASHTNTAGWSGPILSNLDITNRKISLIWKIAKSNNEPAIRFNTSTVSNTSDSVAWIMCFRGVNPVSPINAYQASVRNSTTSLNVDITGLTTTEDNCLVVSFTTTQVESNPDMISGWANSSLDSISELFDLNFGNDNGGSFAAAAGVKKESGVVSNTTATLRNISPILNYAGNQLMLAIAPKP